MGATCSSNKTVQKVETDLKTLFSNCGSGAACAGANTEQRKALKKMNQDGVYTPEQINKAVSVNWKTVVGKNVEVADKE